MSEAEQLVPGGEIIYRTLLAEEIERIVAETQSSGATLRTSFHAASLFAAYPGANFSVGRIIDELVVAASAAKVPVEIAWPNGDGS
jgi:hypothetical protein